MKKHIQAKTQTNKTLKHNNKNLFKNAYNIKQQPQK